MNRTQTPLTSGQQYALVMAVAGMLAVGAYGLVISYWTVRELAERLHMPLPHIFPVGIEGGMIAVLAIDIVLTWIGRPIGWLRQVARVLSGTAIGINAYAGLEYGLAAVIMHALAPAILIVGVEALRHHLLAVLQVPQEREPIPRGRWVLAPLSTIAMWRRMVLWQQPRYSEALDTHLDRHEAIVELRRAFGRRWQNHVPAGLAYRLRVGVRLDESVAEVRALLDQHYAHTDYQLSVDSSPMRAHTVTEWVEPVRVPLPSGAHTVAGGDRVDGHLSPGGRALLPIECAQSARARTEALEAGARAVAQLEDWRARERAAGVRTRMRTQALAAASGGSARTPREETPRARQSSAPVPARTPAREVVTERVPEAPGGAVASKRAQGARTRERITAHLEQHPAHTADQIATHVGVTASTVRRHLAKIRANNNGTRREQASGSPLL